MTEPNLSRGPQVAVAATATSLTPGLAIAELFEWSTPVTVVTTNPLALGLAVDYTRHTLAAVADVASRFDPTSEINRLAPHLATGVTPSVLLAQLIRTALEIAESTDGDVDAAIGPTLAHLGYDEDVASLLSPTRLAETQVAVDPQLTTRGWQRPVDTRQFQTEFARRASLPTWRSLRWRDGQLFGPAGLVLDLGVCAPAFTADRLAKTMSTEFGCGVLVDIGGDLATAGPAPVDGWRVRLPGEAGGRELCVPAGMALATTGTHSRRWAHAGRILHHIVDPRTRQPVVDPPRAVTVLADTCVQANAAATATVVRRGATNVLAGLSAQIVHADSSVTLHGRWR